MRKPFGLIATIVAVVGLATTPQSGLAKEGVAVSKNKPAVQCWTTSPLAEAKQSRRWRPTAASSRPPMRSRSPTRAVGAFSLSWRHWGAPKARGKGKACSSLSGPSPNGCARVTFILTNLRYKASCQQRMSSKVRFEVKGETDFAHRYGGCS